MSGALILKITLAKIDEIYLSVKCGKREKFFHRASPTPARISIPDPPAAAYQRFLEFLVKNFLTWNLGREARRNTKGAHPGRPD
jgi:hypothetical protein